MNLSASRLAIALTASGTLLLMIGVSVWALKMPSDLSGLRNGYYECLWSPTYRTDATDSIDVLAKLRNPAWDPAHTSCANAEKNQYVNLVREARRDSQRIIGGRALDSQVEREPPFFTTPPFLNAFGIGLLVLGFLLGFALVRKTPGT